jgi:hypothetical protein
MTILNFFYLYCVVGILVTLALLRINKNKEKDIDEIVQNKISEMRNDGSFSFYSANLIGHLIAYCLSMIFWPIFVIKKLTGK